MTEDRRVGRTKRLLKRALFELLDEVGYDRITIAALTERADVGRSTFYSHFASKEDLLLDGFDGWVARVGAPRPGGVTEAPAGPDAGTAEHAGSLSDEAGASDPARFRFALPMLHHIAHQRRFFEAVMVRSRSARIRRRVTAIMVRRIQAELTRMGGDASEAAAHAVAGAFLELATWWLGAGLGTPVGEVEAVFQNVVASGPTRGA